jgi:t-SNARE complex subunit (syntaxin)
LQKSKGKHFVVNDQFAMQKFDDYTQNSSDLQSKFKNQYQNNSRGAWGDFHTGEKLIQGIFCLYKILKNFKKFQKINKNVLKVSTENQRI